MNISPGSDAQGGLFRCCATRIRAGTTRPLCRVLLVIVCTRAVVPEQRPGATKRQTVSATALLADQHALRGTSAAQVRYLVCVGVRSRDQYLRWGRPLQVGQRPEQGAF